LARKQHTINVILQTIINDHLRDSMDDVMKMIRQGPCPKTFGDTEPEQKNRQSFQLIANLFEFVAAGIRNGDFDERLVSDSQRGAILTFYEWAHDFIWNLRTTRRRVTAYEHLQWLHARWETKPPGHAQRFIEWIRGYPFYGRRARPGH
jgi:hypothetical protein